MNGTKKVHDMCWEKTIKKGEKKKTKGGKEEGEMDARIPVIQLGHHLLFILEPHLAAFSIVSFWMSAQLSA